jgi:hypothetical protein
MSTSFTVDRPDYVHENDRNGAGRQLQCRHRRAAVRQYDVRRERSQFRRASAKLIDIACALTIFDPHIASDGPTPIAAAPGQKP